MITKKLLLFPAAAFAVYPSMDLRGDVWPKPQTYKIDRNLAYPVESLKIDYQLDTDACDIILHDNIERYHAIFQLENIHWGGNVTPDQKFASSVKISETKIQHVHLEIADPTTCHNYPQFGDDESYEIVVSNSDTIVVSSNTIWGSMRGLETISQMYFMQNGQKYIFDSKITDAPRFSWRGFFLDTSRHFQTKSVIKQLLDGMAYNKLNVFHWHMVNDQSYSFGASEKYPFLVTNSAYSPWQKHSFSKNDVLEIIEYGRNRGIRVYPEFDTPGHVRSWCDAFDKNGYEQFCTRCPGNSWDKDQLDRFNGWGPINPSKEENYEILDNMWGEIRDIFQDDYIHIGGDEVPDNCWLNNTDPYVNQTEFQAWARNLGLKDKWEIQDWHLNRIRDISTQHNFKMIEWNDAEEIFEDSPDFMSKQIKVEAKKQENLIKKANDQLPILHVWQPWGWNGTVDRFDKPTCCEGWKDIVKQATELNYDVVLSTNWYLDLIEYPKGGKSADWTKFYNNNPTDFEGTEQQKSQVLGGEGAWWTEYIDSSGIVSRSYPRLSGIAERLWSDFEQTKDVDYAFPRLDQFRCRMVNRDIPAEPIG